MLHISFNSWPFCHRILNLFFSFLFLIFSVKTERGKNGRNVILPKIDNGRNHEVLARKEARSRGHGGHSHVSRKKRHGHVPQVRYLRDSLSEENINRTFKKKSLDNTELSVFEKVKYLLCFIWNHKSKGHGGHSYFVILSEPQYFVPSYWHDSKWPFSIGFCNSQPNCLKHA